jgi:hypothetical protein
VRDGDRQHHRSLTLLREAITRTSLALVKSRELLSRLSASSRDGHVCHDVPAEHSSSCDARETR